MQDNIYLEDSWIAKLVYYITRPWPLHVLFILPIGLPIALIESIVDAIKDKESFIEWYKEICVSAKVIYKTYTYRGCYRGYLSMVNNLIDNELCNL